MYYTVTARLRYDTAADLQRKLTEGSITSQKPDGKEIAASMQRAVIDDEGVVRWSEVCYCSTPLEHERATVYDQHFTNLEVAEVEDYVQFEGKPLMALLTSGLK